MVVVSVAADPTLPALSVKVTDRVRTPSPSPLTSILVI